MKSFLFIWLLPTATLAAAMPHSLRDVCAGLPTSGLLSAATNLLCEKITLTNEGCSVNVKFPWNLPKSSFTLDDDTSKTFLAQRGQTLQLDAQPKADHSAAVWTGTSDDGKNPTTYKVPLTGDLPDIKVSCPEICVATNKPCNINDPAMCCTRTCGVKPDIGPWYYCY
ncbi:uncharacterized protein BO97DRAFT_427775 [Aspergillus homomorphus CBS 101889]|uniref:Uncharacterized protein n=1 Tax=Aspergillus homomorphus (strain CBS 101889) TaxID=1450537 RepID=A0A395HMD8_ASPHC|nr:hypothetical protein BO97DRAFT_427775 [Aspergillus homomorphus CBS 101889]RAL09101.1 hypothetical protein BO97DRAFT_427775 [Aspergillus homomorphus CBS 101889]